MTHPTWQLDLDCGALVLTPCPGTKGIDLDTSLAQLKEQGVEAIVTALDSAELASKDVAALGEKTQQLGMQWFQIERTESVRNGVSGVRADQQEDIRQKVEGHLQWSAAAQNAP